MTPPRCKLDDEPMRLRKNGYWRCPACVRRYVADKYANDPVYRERKKALDRTRLRDKYANDPEYRAKTIAKSAERNFLSRTWGY